MLLSLYTSFRIGTVIFIAGTVTFCLAHSLIEGVSGLALVPMPRHDLELRVMRDWALPHTLSLYIYLSSHLFSNSLREVHSLTQQIFFDPPRGIRGLTRRVAATPDLARGDKSGKLCSDLATLRGCPTGWPQVTALQVLLAALFLVRRAIEGVCNTGDALPSRTRFLEAAALLLRILAAALEGPSSRSLVKAVLQVADSALVQELAGLAHARVGGSIGGKWIS